jgi:hypothetical protein
VNRILTGAVFFPLLLVASPVRATEQSGCSGKMRDGRLFIVNFVAATSILVEKVAKVTVGTESVLFVDDAN